MTSPQRQRSMRIYAILSSLVLGTTLLYVCLVFLSRWQRDREIEDQSAAKKRAEAKSAFDAMGGNNFEILNFYASPGFIKRGESLQLCYGTSNAESVHINPEIRGIHPGLSRCVRVAPQKTTKYTLTAEDSAGHIKTATVVVQVR